MHFEVVSVHFNAQFPRRCVRSGRSLPAVLPLLHQRLGALAEEVNVG
jgi:hypothetical protein